MKNPKDCNPEQALFFLGDVVVDGNLLRAKSGPECCLRCQENDGERSKAQGLLDCDQHWYPGNVRMVLSPFAQYWQMLQV